MGNLEKITRHPSLDFVASCWHKPLHLMRLIPAQIGNALFSSQTGSQLSSKFSSVFLRCLMLYFCLLWFCNAPVFAQTKVPLLFGENKNEKGEMIPLGDPFVKIFSFIEKDLKIKFELQIYPWNRAVMLATNGRGLIFGLSLTQERDAIFSFTEPAMYRHLWLVTRSDRRFKFNKLEDLKGKTIGIVRGSKYGGDFDAQKGILFQTDDDIDAYAPRLKKLLNQRIDAMVFASSLTDASEVEKVVSAIKLYNENDTTEPSYRQFSVLPVPILKDGIRFAMLKGKNDQLVKKIDQSLQRFHAYEASVLRKKVTSQRKP
ncbi:substrate-binding periplasmic protein [Undibacterium sp. Di24W]|uniref:substrate-binding periplasmic protein n=1 Tax=Undibacterium sp. Di24W TaxID=3413033 RepID=UPI003BF1E8B5